MPWQPRQHRQPVQEAAMSVDATMAVLYAQTNLAANVSNAAAVAPQASVAMSRVLAAAMAKQEQQQVAKTDPGHQAALTPDAENRGAPQFGSRRRRRPHPNQNPKQPVNWLPHLWVTC